MNSGSAIPNWISEIGLNDLPHNTSDTTDNQAADTKNTADSTDISSEKKNDDEANDSTPHILVAYFSTPEITDATTTASRITVNGKLYGTTEYMADIIHENTDSDLFKIEFEEPYGTYIPNRAKNEQDNEILPKLSTHIESLDRYDICRVSDMVV